MKTTILAAVLSPILKGLILFSPAIEIKTKFGFLANWHKVISWIWARFKWTRIAEDEDFAKYESFAFNAADQIHLLTKQISRLRDGRSLRSPMFVALSEDDTTIDAEPVLELFREQKHPKSRLILYTNAPATDADKRIVRIPSAFPDERILNFSHLSVHLPPNNPHYGRNGDYRNCLHYLKDEAKSALCRAGGKAVLLGEVTGENLQRHVIRRLTYNPDFSNMIAKLERFLTDVGAADPQAR